MNGPPSLLNNRYRLVEWRGGGGMGVVYRARDEILERDVALKFLAPQNVASDESGARFMREARAVARLSHPHIMTLYDVGREGEWHYMVLEYIPGQDLRAAVSQCTGAMPFRDVLTIVRAILGALAYAHARGILHRDIKPENIMISPDRQVKVTDFGLSLIQNHARLTQTGVILGTVAYMAPEIITGQPPTVHSDLYAVGVVLYELLTGMLPFHADTQDATLAQILHAPLPPLKSSASVPQVVVDVTQKLLAKAPQARYASAGDVLDALPSTSGPALSSTGEEDGSLLERIARRATPTARRRAAQPAGDGTQVIMEPKTSLAPAESLLLYAAQDETIAAVEAERRRLARRLQDDVLESLNLLLSQTQAYSRALGNISPARTAFSMLTNLSQQVVQQVRDLEANLHPNILETLGLEPALDSLANQATRAYGVQMTLHLERLPERLASPLELVLFRVTQNILEHTIRQTHATQVTIYLEQRESQVMLSFHIGGTRSAIQDSAIQASRQWVVHLGGTFNIIRAPGGLIEVRICFSHETQVELTPREMDVIQLLVEGLSNKEIAQRLFISPRTVNFHLNNIYSKLGVNSRTEAAIYALRHGWTGKIAKE